MTPPKANSTYGNGRAGKTLDAALKKQGWVPAPTRCGSCGYDLSFGTDGNGSEVSWCAICQEGTKPLSRSSVNAARRGALVSQGLVPALPTVRPGQLRCQRCAHGVEGTKRFCAPCTRDGLEVAP